MVLILWQQTERQNTILRTTIPFTGTVCGVFSLFPPNATFPMLFYMFHIEVREWSIEDGTERVHLPLHLRVHNKLVYSLNLDHARGIQCLFYISELEANELYELRYMLYIVHRYRHYMYA